MEKYLGAMDPETLMKTWFPAGLKGFEGFGETFWSQFAKGAGGKSDKK